MTINYCRVGVRERQYSIVQMRQKYRQYANFIVRKVLNQPKWLKKGGYSKVARAGTEGTYGVYFLIAAQTIGHNTYRLR